MEALSAYVFAHPFWIWLAIGAVFLAAEAATGSGWMLWPAAAAALVAIVSLLLPHLGAPVGIAVFAMATLVLTFLGRRYLKATAPSGADINDAHGRLIGHRGETCGAFEAGLGRVFVDGKEWAAELADAGALPAGARVEVTAVVGGARLRVRPL